MLTMTPGFAWRQFDVNDDRNDGMRMWNTGDVIAYVLGKPLEAAPGKKYNYTNGVPTVTGALIKNAVGMEVTAFAEQHLFHSLGIADYVWNCGNNRVAQEQPPDGSKAVCQYVVGLSTQTYTATLNVKDKGTGVFDDATGDWQCAKTSPADTISIVVELASTP